MARIETTLDYVKQKQDEQSATIKGVHDKIDLFIAATDKAVAAQEVKYDAKFATKEEIKPMQTVYNHAVLVVVGFILLALLTLLFVKGQVSAAAPALFLLPQTFRSHSRE